MKTWGVVAVTLGVVATGYVVYKEIKTNSMRNYMKKKLPEVLSVLKKDKE